MYSIPQLVKRTSITIIISVIVVIFRYRVLRDPGGWLNVDKNTGLITVKSPMDRESTFVKDNKYTALIGAYDNGQ